jgi:hypothetical protein
LRTKKNTSVNKKTDIPSLKVNEYWTDKKTSTRKTKSTKTNATSNRKKQRRKTKQLKKNIRLLVPKKQSVIVRKKAQKQ